jgi:hypothetical protein
MERSEHTPQRIHISPVYSIELPDLELEQWVRVSASA